MSKAATFTVSRRGGPSVEVTFNEPENLEDERWNEIVSNPDEDINTLALKALRVSLQAGARGYLDDGEDAVQSYVDTYQYKSGRGGGGRRAKPVTKEMQKKGKFTAEQLEVLKAAGFAIEG